MFPAPLIAAAALTAAAADRDLLDRDLTWQVVNDGVMGGRSQGRITQKRGPGLTFTGNLSLENNGGFASVRSRPTALELDEARGLRVELDGDGRTWLLTLRRGDVPLRAGSYRVALETTAGETTVHEVAWTDFVATSFGRPVRGAPPIESDLSQVDSVGLMVADKQPGPFEVTLRSLTPLAEAPARAAPPAGRGAIQDTFAAAIRLGVPAFNGGDAGRCRAHYQTAIESVLLLGADALGPGEVELLAGALQQAAREADADAAWTLRRAMDAVLVR